MSIRSNLFALYNCRESEASHSASDLIFSVSSSFNYLHPAFDIRVQIISNPDSHSQCTRKKKWVIFPFPMLYQHPLLYYLGATMRKVVVGTPKQDACQCFLPSPWVEILKMINYWWRNWKRHSYREFLHEQFDWVKKNCSHKVILPISWPAP